MNSPPVEASDLHGDVAADLAVTQDRLFGGRLQIMQPARGHRAGTDAVLLAAATPATDGLTIDVGAGVGTVGLMLALRNTRSRAILLERNPVFASLARRNVDANALAARVSVAETDVLAALVRRGAGVRNESADVVVTNPPFYDADRGRRSRDPLKGTAHVIEGSLSDWLRACLTLLRPGGQLVLIHRPEALAAILPSMGRAAGALRIRAVHPRAGVNAVRVLVQATKGSRAPLELLPPLVLHDKSGAFTAEAAALHGGHATLVA